MEDCAQDNTENNADRQLFTESVQFCVDYLKSNNYILDQNVIVISDQSRSIGLDLVNLIITYMESLEKVESDELFIETNDQSMEVEAEQDSNPNQNQNTPEGRESSSGMKTVIKNNF